ncbi:hypothetical protein DFS34DRAFT_578633, partial [Phlyctochytrium arcticum]
QQEPLKRLSEALYRKGFLLSRFSDISVRILGMTYRLHRIVLLTSPYFASMLDGGPWKEAGCSELEITIEDPNVTVEGVTAVLSRMYGRTEVTLTTRTAPSVLGAGLFFGDKELCESVVEFITGDVSASTVLDYILLADRFCYGVHSETIAEACLTYLCREGYAHRDLVPVFETMPVALFERIVTSDCFWVPGEEQRWEFVEDSGDSESEGEKEESDQEVTVAVKQSELPLVDGGLMLEPTPPIRSPSEVSVQDDLDHYHAPPSPTPSTYSSSSHSSTSSAVSPTHLFHRILTNGIAYMHLPFHTLRALHSYSTTASQNHLPPNLFHEAIWFQKDLQDLITSSTDESTQLDIDEPEVVPRNDTRHIDGRRLTQVLDAQFLYAHRKLRYAPMRFGVEFTDLQRVASGEKVTSRQYFYAGSMWQIYVQTLVVDDTPKLGIYLQRMPIPTPKSRAGAASATTADLFPLMPEPYTQLPPATPYIDPRKTTVTWFQLYCYFGSSCYVLESKPDKFQLTQSWGWRINKLYRDAFEGGRRLKCCVVLGHV